MYKKTAKITTKTTAKKVGLVVLLGVMYGLFIVPIFIITMLLFIGGVISFRHFMDKLGFFKAIKTYSTDTAKDKHHHQKHHHHQKQQHQQSHPLAELHQESSQNQSTSSKNERIVSGENAPTTSSKNKHIVSGENAPTTSSKNKHIVSGKNAPTTSSKNERIVSSENAPTTSSENEHIWVHVASLGEWRTAVPLIAGLRKKYPDMYIALTYFNEEMRTFTNASANITTDASANISTNTSTNARANTSTNARANISTNARENTSISKDNAIFTELVNVHGFMSLENPLATRRWMRRFNVKMLIVIETEIWPLMLMTANIMNIPIVLASGVLFEKEFRRLKRLRWFVRPVVRTFTQLLVISEQVKGFFVQLGVDIERISVVGSLKMTPPLASTDLLAKNPSSTASLTKNKPLPVNKPLLPLLSTELPAALKEWISSPNSPNSPNFLNSPNKHPLSLSAEENTSSQSTLSAEENTSSQSALSAEINTSNRPKLICLASIHFKEIKKIYPVLKEKFHSPSYRFLIAPRKIREEKHKFLRFFNSENLAITIRSEMHSPADPMGSHLGSHLLLDTFGELALVFRGCDVVILGGTFIPIGGHNVLEPLRAGSPTIVGPYRHHIRDLVAGFSGIAGFEICETLGDLTPALQLIEERFLSGNSIEERFLSEDSNLTSPASSISPLNLYRNRVAEVFAKHQNVTAAIIEKIDDLFQ